MFDFPFFVDVLFRIINLAVLIWVLRYIFKTYVLESIKNKIEERRQQIRSLEEHLIAVQHQRDILAAIIDQESGLSLQMQKKISRWAEAVAMEIIMRNREKEQRLRTILAQLEQKKEALLLQEIESKVIPRALDTVEAELKKEFSDPELGAAVIDSIMAKLKAEA